MKYILIIAQLFYSLWLIFELSTNCREAPGTEFVLQDAQPPHLFVIRKQFRSVSGAITTAAYYYVLDGTIYQAPTLHAALCCRVVRFDKLPHACLQENEYFTI